jgi:serine/threonine-protein kinase
VSGILLIFILISGISATLWQARKVTFQRDQAEYEADKANQITAFIIDLFDHSDPDQAQGAVITSETMLAAGSEKLSDLDGQPALQAEMYRVVGNLYRKQNNFEQAELHLTKAMHLFELEHGENHIEVGQTKLLLAELYAFQNRTAETIEESKSASAIFEIYLGVESLEYVRAQNYLARGEVQMGKYREALERLGSAQQEAEKWTNLTDAQNSALVSIYNDIGMTYNAIGDRENFRFYLKKALAVMRRAKGEKNQNVAALYNNLSHSFYFTEEYDSSKYYSLKALEIADEVYRGKPNDRSQFAHCHLAKIFIELGDFDEAQKHAEMCYSLSRDVYGPTHMATGRGLSVLGDVYIAKGDFPKSEEYREEATLIYEAFFDGEDPMLAWHYWDESERYYQSGNLQNAIAYKRRCIAMYEKIMPEELDDLAEARQILARYLMEDETYEEVPALLEKSLAHYAESAGEEGDATKAVAADLITAYERTNQPEKASDLRIKMSGKQL